ncbi:MAG: hypothetical protein ACYTHJ_22560 [Planctomycetota bacterium]|jgi:hypothetical protein
MRQTATYLLGLLVAIWTGYTLSAVLWFGGAVLLDFDTTSRIMSVRNDELIHSAIGLTYHGVGGALLVLIETIALLAALWFGIRADGGKRLAAVIVVVAWTALWLGNAIWLQSLGWSRSVDLWLMVAAMLITLAWAGLRVTEPNPGVDSGKDNVG